MAKIPAMSRYEDIRDDWMIANDAERKQMIDDLENMQDNFAAYQMTDDDLVKVSKLRVLIVPGARKSLNTNWLLSEFAPGADKPEVP